MDKSIARIELACGSSVSADYPEGFNPRGKVTVIVRPEHANLTGDTVKGVIAGTLSNIVYIGTDTHYYVTLDSGSEEFIVRQQNGRSDAVADETGAREGIQFEKNGARVLRH
jgi:spermidine/putrescine transport system ATP-binding protein